MTIEVVKNESLPGCCHWLRRSINGEARTLDHIAAKLPNAHVTVVCKNCGTASAGIVPEDVKAKRYVVLWEESADHWFGKYSYYEVESA